MWDYSTPGLAGREQRPCYNGHMADPAQPVHLLRSIFFLRDLDDSALDRLAASLVAEEHAAGQTIVKEGATFTGLYLILSGSVERRPLSAQAAHAHHTLKTGDAFGALELLHGQRWSATYAAIEPTKLLLWRRREAVAFFQKQPAASADLRFAVRSQVLAQTLRFSWLSENESIEGVSRKHPALLLRALLMPALLLVAAAALMWWGSSAVGDPLIWLASGVAAVGVLYGIWKWLDWGNDSYLVTNRRVVRLEKVIGIYDSRREAPLHNVQSVSVSTTVLGRLLGFGDVIIRTYTGQIVFPNIDNPYAMASIVEKLWRRASENRDLEDRETKIRAIRQLAEHQPEPQPETVSLEDQARSDETQVAAEIGLGRWTFKMRFEEQGVITYRKHWAVLLRQTAFPSICVLALAGLLGARLSGMIALLPLSTFLQVGGTMILGFALYWLYEYADWANDIYQITPTHILDVHRKPLAREVRNVAPLESILGTEVDRKGIIGLLLNYGDVISTIGTEQFVFKGVFDPVGVQQDIVRGLEALIERKQAYERQHKRDEMVEWLGVYHDEFSSRRSQERKGKDR